MAYKDFTELSVWQKGYNLVLKIYNCTKKFPSDERFGLIDQVRRASNSVIHNIAEGFGRYGNKDKTRFYKIARGSAYEVMSQILVSNGLKYINEEEKNILIREYKEVIEELDKIIRTVENR